MFRELKLQDEYLPSSEFQPEYFFRSVIGEAKIYKRAAGYFSSSIFDLFKPEFLDFAKGNGSIKIVCSNQLSNDDFEAAKNASETPEHRDFENYIDQELDRIEAAENGVNALSFFATLIETGILEIKIASQNSGGIFHDKTGVFTDAKGDRVSFRGSSNETFMGWSRLGNFETLEVFKSWDLGDQRRVRNHETYLDALWGNNISNLEVSPLQDVSIEKIVSRKKENIDDFLEIFKQLLSRSKHHDDLEGNRPKRKLNSFQEKTISNWNANGCKGIIKHATGSGKTVTAISAIAQQFAAKRPTVVVVPSKLLLQQWYEEILIDIPDASILRCGAGHTKWKANFRIRKLLATKNARSSAIILTTTDTMVTENFISQLGDLSDALLVADEMHVLGSKSNRQILKKNFGKRLGLSATPERYGDPEGTALLFKFFERVLEPVVSIDDAIKNGRLVRYIYEPVGVPLTEQELEEWKKFTRQLVRLGFGSQKNSNQETSDTIKKLLIRRSRVAKKAENKITKATGILLSQYRAGDYWLIYCEDMEQLNALDSALKANDFSPHIYATGLVGSPQAELDDFIKNGGVMLSIRCLDEGVDIPRISHALILASSNNPRQFIQRRGRVLRVDGVKSKAAIYDLFVLPKNEDGFVANSIVENELARALEFSNFAMNKETAKMRLRRFMIELDLNPDKVEDITDLEEDNFSEKYELEL